MPLLEQGDPARSVPKVENFYCFLPFVDSVIDPHRSVEKLAHSCSSGYRDTDVGKTAQDADVIDKNRSKPSGGFRTVRANVIENGF